MLNVRGAINISEVMYLFEKKSSEGTRKNERFKRVNTTLSTGVDRCVKMRRVNETSLFDNRCSVRIAIDLREDRRGGGVRGARATLLSWPAGRSPSSDVLGRGNTSALSVGSSTVRLSGARR